MADYFTLVNPGASHTNHFFDHDEIQRSAENIARSEAREFELLSLSLVHGDNEPVPTSAAGPISPPPPSPSSISAFSPSPSPPPKKKARRSRITATTTFSRPTDLTTNNNNNTTTTSAASSNSSSPTTTLSTPTTTNLPPATASASTHLFPCPRPRCSSSFTTKFRLHRHDLYVHQGYRPHFCPYCPQRFSDPRSRNRHVEKNTCGNVPAAGDGGEGEEEENDK